MAVQLIPSTEFSIAALAELFTAAYEGYYVPFNVDEQALAYMVDAFDLDLAESLVAVEDGTPVGLANLGRRGERTWLGGIGVVARRRRGGLGEMLSEALLARARAVGAKEMVLEVIVENAPAIALYEKLRFGTTRELEVLSLAADESGGEAEDLPVEAAQPLISARRDGPEPWQRGDETLANLRQRRAELQALVSGDAAAIYRVDGARVSLLQAAGGGRRAAGGGRRAAGGERGLHDVVAALRAKGVVSAVNYPAGGPVANVLSAAGADVVLRQYEMVLGL